MIATERKRLPYTMNKKLTVVNFFGGPGVGKSTTAAMLFALLKQQSISVELIHEAAKEYVWEEWSHIFGEQDYIFAHQHRLIRRLTRHNVEYAIVDSSILLSLFYMPDDFPHSFRQFVRDVFETYDNVNIFLERNRQFEYQQDGRNENFQEALEIDRNIREYFVSNQIPFHVVLAGSTAADECAKIVLQHQRHK